MGHTVGDQANRAVKKSEKHQADLARTPEQRLSAIRSSLAAKLFVTPDDQRFLLELYDVNRVGYEMNRASYEFERRENDILNANLILARTAIVELNAQVEQFRTVYEQENSSTSIKVERVAGERELPNAESEIDHQLSPGGPSF